MALSILEIEVDKIVTLIQCPVRSTCLCEACSIREGVCSLGRSEQIYMNEVFCHLALIIWHVIYDSVPLFFLKAGYLRPTWDGKEYFGKHLILICVKVICIFLKLVIDIVIFLSEMRPVIKANPKVNPVFVQFVEQGKDVVRLGCGESFDTRLTLAYFGLICSTPNLLFINYLSR